MKNYIQKVEDLLEEKLKFRGTIYEDLLGHYALLVLTVGENCTKQHVHDAWSVWQNKKQPEHRSIKPFEKLDKDVQSLDEPYKQAVIDVATILFWERWNNN